MLVETGKPIVSRTHDVRGNTRNGSHDCWQALCNGLGEPLFKRMILVLRDFRECHLGELSPELEYLESYSENIKAYHNFPGDKVLAYYEDIVSDFSVVIRILDFIGIAHNIQEFDMEFHQKKSVMIYHRRRFSHTRNNLLDFRHHARTASRKTVEEIENHVKSMLGKVLCERYLHRYFNHLLSVEKD
jgi:hypothetical protein